MRAPPFVGRTDDFWRPCQRGLTEPAEINLTTSADENRRAPIVKWSSQFPASAGGRSAPVRAKSLRAVNTSSVRQQTKERDDTQTARRDRGGRLSATSLAGVVAGQSMDVTVIVSFVPANP